VGVTHIHGYKSDIVGFITARKIGIKCVSTLHGFGLPSSIKLRAFIRMVIWMLKYFDKVVPLSMQLKDEVIAFGVSKRKIEYIQNGVDLSEV
jgi:glycosyltransferase involved in cell wall biosynthesis